jgi:hypothetical protein
MTKFYLRTARPVCRASNDLYILTHPEVRDVVAGRFDQILAAFDKASLHEASTPPEAVSARP